MSTSPRSSRADLVIDRLLPTAIGLAAVGVGAFAAPGLAGASEPSALASGSPVISSVFPTHGLADLQAIQSDDDDADAESAADDGSEPAADPEGVVESGLDGVVGAVGGDASDGGDGGDGLPGGDDQTIEAVVIDLKRRTVTRPKTFAASKLVKVSGVKWAAWGTPTATGRGRVVSLKKGKGGRTVKGTGTVVLSALKTCPDATPLYRRATVKVAGRKLASVSLPGCSELR